MAKPVRTAKSVLAALIKDQMPGWSVAEAQTRAAPDAGAPAADFQGKELGVVIEKYHLAAADSVPEPAGEDAALVQVKPKGHEDGSTGSKTVVVSNGRIVGMQG